MKRVTLAIVIGMLLSCSRERRPVPAVATPAQAAPIPVAAPPEPAAAATNPAPANPAPADPAPVAERPPAAAPRPWVTFSRAACFGTCPVYAVRVLSDGTVEYDGQAYVKEKGRRTKKLTGESSKQLSDLVSDPRFRALDAKCCDCYEVTDQPTVTIEVRESASVTRAIVHYYGCTRAPKFLRPLEDSIDQLIGTEAWVGTPKQRENIDR
jgi:hypothetical protein